MQKVLLDNFLSFLRKLAEHFEQLNLLHRREEPLKDEHRLIDCPNRLIYLTMQFIKSMRMARLCVIENTSS